MSTPLAALDAAQAAHDGGFYYNHGIVWILAIGMAESHTDTHGLVMDSSARHTNSDGSIDRGWLQINSIHTDISDADCDDPVKAATYAWNKLTAQGTKFTAWSTYNNGQAQSFFAVASAIFQLWSAQQQVSNLQAQLATVTANLTACQTQLAADETEIAGLQDQLAAAQAAILALDKKIGAARADLA